MELELRSPLGRALEKVVGLLDGRGKIVRSDDDGNEVTWQIRWNG